MPLKFFIKQCEDVFGFNMTELPRVDAINVNFGGQQPIGATKIFWVNGAWDEWQRLSVEEQLVPSQPAIVIKDSAHCGNMDQYDPRYMSPHILAAQKKIAQQIGQWI